MVRGIATAQLHTPPLAVGSPVCRTLEVAPQRATHEAREHVDQRRLARAGDGARRGVRRRAEAEAAAARQRRVDRLGCGISFTRHCQKGNSHRGYEVRSFMSKHV